MMRSVVTAVVERADAMTLFLLSSVSLIAWAAASANATNSNVDRVLLSDVMAITLIDGHMTKTRHNSSVPQLICVGGEAGCLGDVPMVVLCINGGQNKHLHNSIQWKCSSSKDLEENGLEMVPLNVSCEGYDHPNDPYIVKGSCSLSYKLDWSDDGTDEDDQSFSDMLSWIVLIVVGVLWILLILCCLALRYCEIPSKSPPNSVEAQLSSSSTAYLIPPDYKNGYQPIDGGADSSSSNSVTPEVQTMIR